MIEVENLTRSFGTVRAVDGLTFSVGRGEVVGFLGLNGAGKTTTMRLLTTYLTPTSGRARMAGHDVLDEPLEARRRLGYLPENVPLYGEMRVREYLRFRARIKDVPWSRRRTAIAEALAHCQLEDVADRVIGQLSKGYRQRVGLADALLHDPDILILDEPTAGLDPVQVREVRALIRALGERHTLLVSTHIMSEVEAVCGRVLIIHRGRLVLDEPTDSGRSAGSIAVEARGPAEALRRCLESIPAVEKVTPLHREGDWSRFDLSPRGGADPREAIAAKLAREGHGLRLLDPRRSSLEERFHEAVGADFRERGD
ncbi:MAG: ATP-binding cassette domain-containing protein [Isosphaeraceae bacterium]